MKTLNTSRAEEVELKLFEYDDIPIALTYTSNTTPIDITDYKFEFFLTKDKGRVTVKTYSIDAGVMSTAFLIKQGADDNVLNIQNMIENVRSIVLDDNVAHKLVQVVTNTDSIRGTQIVYIINAREY